MKILVLNGSPKGENSDTLKITKAFLAGMEEKGEVVNISATAPCRGCLACWYATPGHCVQKDGVEALLAKMCSADLVIWSMPLYCYTMPAGAKAMVERLQPLSSPTQYIDAAGRTHHPNTGLGNTRMMLISGCGFPDRAGNFDALIWQFKRLFGEGCPMILCVEAPLLSVAEAAPLAEGYLALARRAGETFAQTGAIAPDIQAALDAPMFPPEEYRARAGSEA